MLGSGGGGHMSSFYTLLYIANPEDAEEIGLDESEDAGQRWKSLWLRSIGDLELVALWTIIEPSNPENIGTLMADLLFAGGDDGPFVTKVPDGFIQSVATLPDSRIPEVVNAWNQIDEMTHWDEAALANTISAIRALSQQSLASGQSVLQAG